MPGGPQRLEITVDSPLPSVSLGFDFLAMDFFSFTPPVLLSFFGGNFVAVAASAAKLASELEATEAEGKGWSVAK